MARLRTIPFELGIGSATDGNNVYDCYARNSARETTVIRSPGASIKIGGAAAECDAWIAHLNLGSVTCFARFYLYIKSSDGLPASDQSLVFFLDSSGTDLIGVKL